MRRIPTVGPCFTAAPFSSVWTVDVPLGNGGSVGRVGFLMPSLWATSRAKWVKLAPTIRPEIGRCKCSLANTYNNFSAGFQLDRIVPTR
ncbi:MAG TPA: hypothetical protein DCE44_14090 [Verrucomicrobiales bacterium]|nr:hypothetical protein [Verrucomicrobiales bacterium]